MTNRAAFLHLIREGESTHNDDAYTLLNGGTHFGSFADHPYAGQSAPPGKAAGAYQFIPHTWQRVAAAIGAPDFSPEWQDKGALWLIEKCGAMPAVDAGNVAAACRLLASTWISLPSLGTFRAEQVFQRYGGTLAAQAAAPIEDHSTTVTPAKESPMPFLLSLLPMVLQLFAPKAQQVLTKASGNEAGAQQLIQMLIQQGGQLVGIPVSDPAAQPDQALQIVAALKKAQAEAVAAGEPQAPVVQQLQQTAMDWLEKISPMLDKMVAYEKQAAELTVASQDAASARADAKDLRPPLALYIWLAVAILTLLLGSAIVAEIWLRDDHKPDNDLVVLFGTTLTYILARLGDVYGYAFGGVMKSGASDVIANAVRASQPK